MGKECSACTAHALLKFIVRETTGRNEGLTRQCTDNHSLVNLLPYAYMYIHVRTRMYVCTYVLVHIHSIIMLIFWDLFIWVYACIGVYGCVCVHVCVCVWGQMCTKTYVYTYTYVLNQKKLRYVAYGAT